MSDVIYSPSTNHSSGPGAVGSSSSSSFAGTSSGPGVVNSASSVGSFPSDVSTALSMASNVVNANNARYINNANSANDFQMLLQKQSQRFNSVEASTNRQWQEMMSNTAHQREVQDLINAGLNPVLSALNGSGASTPTGATASSSQGNSKMADVDTSNFLGSLLGFMQSVISSATSLESAKISAGATVKSAELSSSATRYASDNSSYAQTHSGALPNIARSVVDAFTNPNRFTGYDYDSYSSDHSKQRIADLYNKRVSGQKFTFKDKINDFLFNFFHSKK